MSRAGPNAISKFSSPVKALDLDDDDFLDRCVAAYCAEYDRWCWRRAQPRVVKAEIPKKTRYELVRNTSPNTQEIFKLSKSECKDHHDAEAWLNTMRGRAAMRAALEAI